MTAEMRLWSRKAEKIGFDGLPSRSDQNFLLVSLMCNAQLPITVAGGCAQQYFSRPGLPVAAPGDHVQQAAIHTLLAPAGSTQLEVQQERNVSRRQSNLYKVIPVLQQQQEQEQEQEQQWCNITRASSRVHTHHHARKKYSLMPTMRHAGGAFIK
jgi:hypothetical protein